MYVTDEAYKLFFEEFKKWIWSKYGHTTFKILESTINTSHEGVGDYIVVTKCTNLINIMWGRVELITNTKNGSTYYDFFENREDGPSLIMYRLDSYTSFFYRLKSTWIYANFLDKDEIVLDSEKFIGVFEKQKRLRANGIVDVICLNEEAKEAAEKEFEDFVHNIKRKI
jgi:hypothetical protein